MVRRRGFHRGEEGATAVLLAILLIGVLIPLSAAALSAYVRTGTIDEVQRSADVGALAGARVIPLGNPEFLRNYLNAIASGGSPVIPSFGGPDPLAEACGRARVALIEDSSLGGDYTDIDAAECSASYTADSGVLGDLGACLQTLADPVAVVPEVTLEVELPGLPEPVPSPSEPSLPLPSPTPTSGGTFEVSIQGQEIANLLYQQLGSVLPALLKPGVRVSLQRTFEGAPLDPVGETDEARTATARRRFKNVVVVPIVEPDYAVESPTGSGIDVDGDGDYEIRFDSTVVEIDGSTIDLNPALEASWDELSSLVSSMSDEVDGLLTEIGDPPAIPGGTVTLDVDSGITIDLPGVSGEIDVKVSAVTPPPIGFDCQLEIKRLLDDLDDIYSPGAGDPPTQQEIIEEAAATGTMVYAFVVGDPTDPSTQMNFGNLTDILGIPFFDFVPVCISGSVAVPTTEEVGCAAGATGGFRASLVPN